MMMLIVMVCSSCGVMFGGSKFHGSIIAQDHPNANIYVDGNNVGEGTAIVLHPRN